jgi:hypothetical protein
MVVLDVIKQLANVFALDGSEVPRRPSRIDMLAHEPFDLGSAAQALLDYVTLEPFRGDSLKTFGHGLPNRLDDLLGFVTSILDRHRRRADRTPVLLGESRLQKTLSRSAGL